MHCSSPEMNYLAVLVRLQSPAWCSEFLLHSVIWSSLFLCWEEKLASFPRSLDTWCCMNWIPKALPLLKRHPRCTDSLGRESGAPPVRLFCLAPAPKPYNDRLAGVFTHITSHFGLQSRKKTVFFFCLSTKEMHWPTVGCVCLQPHHKLSIV